MFKQEWLGHHKIYNCPCCGTKALTTDQYRTITADRSVHVYRAGCSSCSYQVEKNLGEPKEFGIMNDELFIYVGQDTKRNDLFA